MNEINRLNGNLPTEEEEKANKKTLDELTEDSEAEVEIVV
jgi:hypothetical protein